MHKSRDTDIDIMDFTKSGSDICRRQKNNIGPLRRLGQKPILQLLV